MTVFCARRSTDGREGVVPVPLGRDRWVIAVRYVRACFLPERTLPTARKHKTPGGVSGVLAFLFKQIHESIEAFWSPSGNHHLSICDGDFRIKLSQNQFLPGQ